MKTNRLISLLLCLCMVVTLFTGFAGTASAAEDYVAHTVKSGENLYTLVGRMGMNYGTVKYVIMALNGFTSEGQLDALQPGQTILLPTSNQAAASLASKALNSNAATTTVALATTAGTGTATATTTTASSTSGTSTYQGYTPSYYLVQHKVQQGETLISICKALGTNYYDYSSVVLKLNNLASESKLRVGDTIWVPAKTGTSGGTIGVIAYSVKSGDNISSICAQYKTNYAEYKDAVKALNPKLGNVEKLTVGTTVYIPVYTSYNNAVAGNASTAAGTSGSPTTNIATGFAIGFTVPQSAKHGNPFAIVGGQANVTRAAAGQTVVVRPNAYDGFAVKSIKVVRTDSNQHVQLNDYSFTMPNSNVQITIEYSAGKKITKMPASNGTFDTMVHGELTTTGYYGDKVEIVPYPNAGWEVGNVTYQVWRNGAAVGAAVNATQNPETGIWSFTMPNDEVRVRVTFQQSNRIRLRYNLGTYRGNGIVLFYKGEQQVTEASKGDTIRAVIVPADGWIIDPATRQGVVDVARGGANDPAAGANVTVPNPNFSTGSRKYPHVGNGLSSGPNLSFIAQKTGGSGEDEIKKINEYIYEFKIPVNGVNTDVVVDVNFKQKTPYALFKENLSGKPQYGTVTFNVTDTVTGEVRKNAEYAYEGDLVEIVPYAGNTAEAGRGYFSYTYDPSGAATAAGSGISGAGTNDYTTLYPSGSLLTTWVDGTVIRNPLNATDTTNRTGYMFIMPASHVNVDPRFYDNGNAGVTVSSTNAVEALIAVMDNEHGKIEVLDAAGNPVHKALPGDLLTVRITADKGYRVQREAFGTVPNTRYGIYLNFNDGATRLTQLDDTGVINTPGTSLAQVQFQREYTNDLGNAVLEFGLVPGAIARGGNLYSVPVTLTAFYETFNATYTDGGGNQVTRNKVQLRTANNNYNPTAGVWTSYGVAYANGESPALLAGTYGVSGGSHVRMYLNGALAADNTTVQVGTTLGLVFEVADGYKLDSVWKTVVGGDAYDNQQLSSVDGVYYYTVTQKDGDAFIAAGNAPILEFEVRTERIAETPRRVLYSTNAGDIGFPAALRYTLNDITKGSGPVQGDLINGAWGQVEKGDTIVLTIPNWAAGAEATMNVRLTKVTVGDINLTMGDLTSTGGAPEGWTYTFIMPDADVKTEVYYEQTQLIDLY